MNADGKVSINVTRVAAVAHGLGVRAGRASCRRRRAARTSLWITARSDPLGMLSRSSAGVTGGKRACGRATRLRPRWTTAWVPSPAPWAQPHGAVGAARL